jgi:hypothetical protein
VGFGSFPLICPIGILKTLHSFANALISITKLKWEKESVATAFVSGEGKTGHADQPHMEAALVDLQKAQIQLELAVPDKGGHREDALHLTAQAIVQVELGIAYADTHHG